MKAMGSIKSNIGMGIVTSLFTGALLFSGSASALPAGWSSLGNAGTLGANGVVTASPQGGSYQYVSTSGGISGLGLGLGSEGYGSETTGSAATTGAFNATAGDDLQFYFNYVTSDGAGYADYAWVRLLDAARNPYATLFTARTTPDGDTVPGYEMPDLDPRVSLDPISTEIIPGAPVWSALGDNSGTCYHVGCGYTDWIGMTYTFEDSGIFFLEFGVVNWDDDNFSSGLAFDGIVVGGVAIDPQPVSAPGTLTLFGIALLGLAGLRRRKI